MPLTIVQNDITKMRVDAVVNAANTGLAPGSGVCGAIFAAAGAGKLDRACQKIGHCAVGQAVITPGFALPANHIIHTIGPIWQGGNQNEAALLKSSYERSLQLAVENGCQSIAFPLISAGIFGYPKADALRIAMTAIYGFLQNHEMQIFLAVLDRNAVVMDGKWITDLQLYFNGSDQTVPNAIMEHCCSDVALFIPNQRLSRDGAGEEGVL
ncbi:MAG: macro domain-containing protein [Oscillospiraceae bacterium]|jgi:O-acetyl-ADP-ribose deacetylase (regulator of RNase III)